MKRGILSLATLLGGALAAHADIIVIKLNLAAVKEQQQNQQMPPGGEGGAGPGMMMGGMPGAGGPGGRGMPGGMSPGGMPGGMSPGGMPGGMSPGGFPGGMSPGGMPGGTMPGGRGSGDTGSPDGGGMPGMAGGGMMMGGPGQGGEGSLMNLIDGEPESAPLFVGAIIEIRPQSGGQTVNGIPYFGHKWGQTHIPSDVNSPYRPQFQLWHVKGPTLAERFDEENKKIRENDETRVAKLLDLGQLALSLGLLDKMKIVMDRLRTADPKLPAVVAFDKVTAEMSRPLTKDDAAVAWKDKLGEFRTKSSAHYTLIYNVPSEKAAESRLKRLEDNYRGFYYWFALKGRALAIPDKRLVAVLVNTPEEFDHQHKDIFDSQTMIVDGFYAVRDNLAVFPMVRRDAAYEGLQKIYPMVMARGNWSEDDLFLAKRTRKEGLSLHDMAYAQTIALIHRAMVDEAEIAAVSHEGTRQLLAATKLLPRNVMLPQWLDFGTASFFETAKGAYWPGLGGRNSPYFVNFKFWNENKTLEKDAALAMKSVLTDKYFNHIADSKNKDGATAKARTMTWALVYYLMEKKLEGLRKYYSELAGLPRDLPLDEDTLTQAFGRAFDLMDASKPDQIDEHKFKVMANEWYTYLKSSPLVFNDPIKIMKDEIRLEKEAELRAQQRNQGQQPGSGLGMPGGMMPGGMMPGGGGMRGGMPGGMSPGGMPGGMPGSMPGGRGGS